MSATRQFLEAVVQMQKQNHNPAKLRYTSTAALVLAYGREFTKVSRDLPPGVEPGTKKECYANALRQARFSRGLTYVEGYATSIIPTGHAWLVDADGTVYDPTWDPGSGQDYFGVPLNTSWAMRQVNQQGFWGVLHFDLPSDQQVELLKNGLPAQAIQRVGSLDTSISRESFRLNLPGRRPLPSTEGPWFHGCSARRAEEVARVGFPADYAPTRATYGTGVYLTTNQREAETYGEVALAVTPGWTNPLVLGSHPAPVSGDSVAGVPMSIKAAFERHWTPGVKFGTLLRQVVTAAGHDAIVFPGQSGVWAVAYTPTRVRAAAVPVTASVAHTAMPVGPLPDLVYRYAKSIRLFPRESGVYAKTRDGQQVGFIRWLHTDLPPDPAGEITYIFVRPEWQRRGVATELLRRARTVEPRIQHSTILTDDGRAWSQKAAGAKERVASQKAAKPVGPEVLWEGLGWDSDIRHAIWENVGTHQKALCGAPAEPQQREFDPDHPRACKRCLRVTKTALPSWRDRGTMPTADVVIAPDLGRSARNTYLVYLHGQPHARRPTLAEAKRSVEETYGPLEWTRVPGDPEPHFDRVHGWTPMFNDAPYYLVVDRLPSMVVEAANRPPQVVRLPVAEVLAMYSAEYDSPVSGTERDLREVDRLHGRPNHLDELTAQIQKSGEVFKPVDALAPPPGEEADGDTLADGHHRAIAASRAGVGTILVRRHFCQVIDEVPEWPTFDDTAHTRHLAAGRVRVSTDVPLAYHEQMTHRLSLHGAPAPEIAAWKERVEERKRAWKRENPGKRPGADQVRRWGQSPAGYTYFNPVAADRKQDILRPAPADLTAFVDVAVYTQMQSGGLVRIGYLAVRPDHRGQGLARQLMQAVYDQWPQAKVHWGKLMDSAMGHLYQQFREQQPERTIGGSDYYSSLRQAGWQPFDPGPGYTLFAWGDAVPGGYNGGIALIDKSTGQQVGSIEYQSAPGYPVKIAMVHVHPDHRRKGLASLLMRALRHDFPDTEIESGYTTPEGSAWWRSVSTGSKAAGLGSVDVASWERTKPWDASREDLDAGRFPGIRRGRSGGTEVASFSPSGQVVVKPEWFDLPFDTRRAVLYHEAGHGLADEMLTRTAQFGLDSPLDLVRWPGANRLGHNYDEVVAEAYSVIWIEPEWFDSDTGKVRDLVVAMARAAGWPLPTSIRSRASLSGSQQHAAASRTFWREHPRRRPFTVEDATSTPFHPPADPAHRGTREGYSAFANLWDLMAYLRLYFAGPSSISDLVRFTGTRIGDGVDGEDLVVPDMARVERHSWSDLTRLLATEPLPPRPRYLPRFVPGRDWDSVARWYHKMEHEDPYEDAVVRRVLGPVPSRERAAAMSGLRGDLPEGLILRVSFREEPDEGWVIASVDGEDVGVLRWSTVSDPATIIDMSVDEGWQRRGIATAMYRKVVEEYEPGLQHSDVFLDDGRAWARSVGWTGSRRVAIPFLRPVDDPLVDTKPMFGRNPMTGEESSFEMLSSYEWVHPQIATGGALRSASHLRQLARKGVTAIVSGRRDFDDKLLDPQGRTGIKILVNPTPDNGQDKPASWFKAAIDFCLPELRRGKRVFVHCFPPGTLVGGEVPTPIEQVDGEVIAHDGSLRKVVQTFEHAYDGPMTTVQATGTLPTTCTPNHKMLVLRGYRWPNGKVAKPGLFERVPGVRRWYRRTPEWVRADEVQPGDYLLSAKWAPPPDTTIHPEVAWALGFFAADGHADDNGIVYTLGLDDDYERIIGALDRLGYRGYVCQETSTWRRVRVNSRKAAREFRAWFGTGAEHKRLPAWLMHADPEALVAGVMAGDGHVLRNRTGSRVLTTTSQTLAYQVWQLVLAQGHKPYLRTRKRYSGYPNGKPLYLVEWNPTGAHSRTGWWTGPDGTEFYLMPIVSVSTEHYTGPVHNFEVDTQHSYHVHGVAVANCHAGLNRGPSMAYAVLRAYTGWDHQRAYSAIKSSRPSATLAYVEDADRALVQLGYAKAPTKDIPDPKFVTLTGSREAARTPSRLWHVTDRSDFVPDPDFLPATAVGPGQHRGLHLTPNPELWKYLWYPMASAWAVEFDVSKVRLQDFSGTNRDQFFLSADQFDEARVLRRVPVEQAIAEAKRSGYGLAMLGADARGGAVHGWHVIDHSTWGSDEALCGQRIDLNAVMWSTAAHAADQPQTCDDCLTRLRRTVRLSKQARLYPDLWYRAHPTGRPFLPETATSREMPSMGFGLPAYMRPQQRGFSCYPDPWWTWTYVAIYGWLGSRLVQDHDVYAFSGERVGKGRDGEDLVVPDMAVVREMSWQEFEQELVRHPLPQTPTPFRSMTWQDFVEAAQEGLRMTPHLADDLVVKFLFRRFGARQTVASAISYEVRPSFPKGNFIALARDGGTVVGALEGGRWGISRVYVDSNYRRRGIATRLYQEVSAALGSPLRVGDDFTEDGAAWASTVSGREEYPTWGSPVSWDEWLVSLERERAAR